MTGISQSSPSAIPGSPLNVGCSGTKNIGLMRVIACLTHTNVSAENLPNSTQLACSEQSLEMFPPPSPKYAIDLGLLFGMPGLEEDYG